MNKIIIIIVAVIIVAGGAFAIKKSNDDKKVQNTNTANSQSADNTSSSGNDLDPNNYTAGANIGETVDATDKSQVSVNIDDFIFKTTYLKIKKGTKVTWTNDGQIGHDVTSSDNSPKTGLASELLSHGDSYSFTFTETGLYEYFCTPHPSEMKAVIKVVD